MSIETSIQPRRAPRPSRARLRPAAKLVARYYVTASHTVRGTGALRAKDVPFTEGHVREVGGEHTACGKPALYWPILWDLKWDEVERPCADCAYQVAAARLETND